MVMIDISERERDAIFKKEIKASDGRTFFLIKEMEAGFDEDKFFSQTVNMGRVIKVADDVKNIMPGDVVIMENLVDANPKYVAEQTDEYKRVVIQAANVYHDDDYWRPPNGTSKGGFVHYKGNLDTRTFIICIVRDKEIIPVGTKVILKNTPIINDPTISRLRVTASRTQMIVRTVLVAAENSGYKKGDMVLVDQGIVATMDISGKLYDYIEEEDVLMQKVKVK